MWPESSSFTDIFIFFSFREHQHFQKILIQSKKKKLVEQRKELLTVWCIFQKLLSDLPYFFLFERKIAWGKTFLYPATLKIENSREEKKKAANQQPFLSHGWFSVLLMRHVQKLLLLIFFFWPPTNFCFCFQHAEKKTFESCFFWTLSFFCLSKRKLLKRKLHEAKACLFAVFCFFLKLYGKKWLAHIG